MNDRIITRKISETGGFIPVGRTGENMFRTVAIDVSKWADEGSECRIIYSRPDEITYPVEVTRKENLVLWTPSAYDTEVSGEGQIEVRAYHGDTIGKSAIFKVKIDESMQANETEPGIARPDWVDDIIDKVVISDMKQTVASTESGGINVFTVTLTSGKSSTFTVRNGLKGNKGDTGEKGDKGDKGDIGPQGPQGIRGEKGNTGAQGADGYTPKRGVDYWTEADKAETIATVLEEADSSMDTKLSGYVKETDFSAAKGIVFASSVSSTGTAYGPQINMATTTEIRDLANKYKPIVPANLEFAVEFVNDILGMATKTYVDNAVSGFATKEELDTALGDISEALDDIVNITEEYINSDSVVVGSPSYDLTDYIKQEEVEEMINTAIADLGTVAKIEYVDEAISTAIEPLATIEYVDTSIQAAVLDSWEEEV